MRFLMNIAGIFYEVSEEMAKDPHPAWPTITPAPFHPTADVKGQAEVFDFDRYSEALGLAGFEEGNIADLEEFDPMKRIADQRLFLKDGNAIYIHRKDAVNHITLGTHTLIDGKIHGLEHIKDVSVADSAGVLMCGIRFLTTFRRKVFDEWLLENFNLNEGD